MRSPRPLLWFRGEEAYPAIFTGILIFFVGISDAFNLPWREETPPVLPDSRKFLRVIVINHALWWPLRLIMDRRSANQVRARITFHTESNDPVFTPGRQMTGRWANTPEPVRPIGISQNPGQNPGQSLKIISLFDHSITREAVDIGSGSSQILDIVMRAPTEDGCRGWHNLIINNPNPIPEYEFNLPQERHRAQVRIDVSGRSIDALFLIVCDIGINDFRLEPISYPR